MRRLILVGWTRLRCLLPRGRREARLAALAKRLIPVLAGLPTASLSDRVLQMRIRQDGLLLDPPPPGLSAHERLALQAALADVLRPGTLPQDVLTAWISVPTPPDGLLYLHVADAHGRHFVGWSDGSCGLFPDAWERRLPETAR